MLFSQRLAELRKAKGLNQRQCAESLGVEPSKYNKWDNGQTRPTDFETVCKIAEFYGTTTDYLFGLSDERSTTPIDLDNFSDFLRLLFVISSSDAVGFDTKEQCIVFDPRLGNFIGEFFKMIELCREGAISKEIFETYCNGIIERYKNTSVKEELSKSFEEAFPPNKNKGDNYELEF